MLTIASLLCGVLILPFVNGSRMKCYQCDGPSCEVVTKYTPKPPGACCFTAATYTEDYGVRCYRGVSVEDNDCDATSCLGCNGLRGDLVYCDCCRGDRCNGQRLDDKALTVDCYSCKNSQAVDVVCPKLRCPSPCCYVAVLKGLDYSIKRGCLKLDYIGDDTCSDTCKTIGELHQNQMVNCRVCTGESEGVCNRAPDSIKCFDCNGDEEGCRNAMQGVGNWDCTTICCYAKAIYGNKGLVYRRGCSAERVDCEEHCRSGSLVDRISCNSCSDNSCNNWELPNKFLCYDSVEDPKAEPKLKQCRGAECCYVAFVRDTAKGPFYAKRGCVGDAGMTCSMERTRYLTERRFYDLHPSGRIGKIIVCDSSQGSGCNDEPLKVLSCYSCSKDCDSVAPDTNSVPCEYPKFCYTYEVSDGGADFAVRGCSGVARKHYQYRSNDIDNACDDLEETHQATHPDGNFGECTTCEFRELCNNRVFTPGLPLVVVPPAVLCYRCNVCNEVDAGTTVIKCSQGGCCYQAAVRTEVAGEYFAKRGCWKKKKVYDSCDLTCKYFELDFITKHPNGTILACFSCGGGDGDNCNHHEFVLANTEKVDKSVMCYNCLDCYTVDGTTPNTDCSDASCCYSAHVLSPRGYALMRNCSKDICSDTCSYFEKYTHVIACSSCKSDGCNNRPYKVDAPPFEPAAISCYVCPNCNQVTGITRTVECENARCCYRALLRSHQYGSLVTERGCANGKICEDTCQYIERRHLKLNPAGAMHTCTQCDQSDGHGCNNRTFEVPRGTGAVRCYDCDHCDKPTTETEGRYCSEAACCYAAYLKNSRHGDYYSTRRCYKPKPGQTCAGACMDVQNEHLWIHPTGKFVKCIPCALNDSDNCNKYPFYPTPDTILEPLSLPPINCYDCTNCYITTEATPAIKCPSPSCCYIAVVKLESDDFNHQVTRSCYTPDKYDECTDACGEAKKGHLWTHPLGQFINCTTCDPTTGDECNNQQFEQPKEFILEGDPFITCYNCKRDCNQVTGSTPKTKCPITSYCYFALMVDTPTSTHPYAVRGCIRSCKNLAPYQLCKTCKDESTVCNKEPYIGTPVPTPTTCYECSRCNLMASMNTTVNCHRPECCYVALVKDTLDQARFAIRGCSNTCTNVCGDVTRLHHLKHPDGFVNFCTACSPKDNPVNCNSHEYIVPKQPRLARKSGRSISCHNCVHCYTAPRKPRKIYCPDNCCYTVVWLEYGDLASARLCADLATTGKTCNTYCTSVRQDVSAHNGTVYHCNTCDTNMCNDETLAKPAKATTEHSASISCYNRTTATECPTNCCYWARLVSRNRNRTERGCAKVLPGRSCQHYCRFITRSFTKTEPTGTVEKCFICSTDGCNQ